MKKKGAWCDLAKSSFFDFLDGYESDKKHGIKSSGGKRFFSRSYSGSVTRSGGAVLKRSVSIGNRITDMLSFTASNAYGAGLLAYGAITFLAYFLIDYFSIPVENGGYSVFVGISAVLIALPFLFSDKPLAAVLQGNRVVDFICFEFFCIKRPHSSEKTKPIPFAVLLIAGAVLGGLGFIIPSWIVGVSVVALLIIFLAFLSPESTFLLSLMALPYIRLIPYSDAVFSALALLTVISFIRKVVCGKRVIFFEQYDLLIGLLAVSFLVSGIFMKGTESFLSSLVMIAMALGYTLSGNLITNRRLAECSLNALVISSIPASAYSLYTFIFAIAAEGPFSGELNFSSTFASRAECAIFLIVSIVFAVALAKHTSGALSVLYGSVAALNTVALLLTGESFAILALVLGGAMYFATRLGWASAPVAIILALVPYSIMLIPDGVAETVARYIPGFEGTAELREVWSASILAFKENIWFGAGMGEQSFAEEMAKQGIFGYTNSQNIFIELGLEAGVFALVILALIFMVRIRHRASYGIYLKQTEMGSLAPYTAAATFALISFGATEYIWSQGTSFYLFFCVFGIGSAMLRVAKKEVDDRTLYYEDTRDVDFSAIDIDLR